MKTQELINKITKRCWEEFQKHQYDIPHRYYVNPNSKTLSVLDGELVTEFTAKGFLIEWIMDSLEKQKGVMLYTCPDNGEIAIENFTDYPEDFSGEAMCETVIPNKFYIAKD